MTTTTRTFEDKPAVRERTPLLVGLIGPSGTGKTFSALRLATGIQRVAGGDIFVVDTEARRSLHYADRFRFRHVAFGAPFSPLDYLAAIEHCVKQGAKTIVVDSLSHEHEGPGGVLEMHANELRRMGGSPGLSMMAWQKPKADRRRFINTLLQMECNFIFCFRAKEKLRIVKGRDPEPRGFMPLAGEEFVYELTLKCLLLPGANGVPTLDPEHVDEQMMVKIPAQFRDLFAKPPQLSEDVGAELARWAEGAAAPPVTPAADLLRSYAACHDTATFRALESQRKSGWSKFSKEEKAVLKTASETAEKRVQGPPDEPPPTGTDGPRKEGPLSPADEAAMKHADWREGDPEAAHNAAVQRWRAHLRAKPWTGEDRGAGAVAGSWLKHRETIEEPGTRLACFNATLEDLAGRGIADGVSWIRGVENEQIRRREEKALRESEDGTVVPLRRPSQAAGLAPTGTG